MGILFPKAEIVNSRQPKHTRCQRRISARPGFLLLTVGPEGGTAFSHLRDESTAGPSKHPPVSSPTSGASWRIFHCDTPYENESDSRPKRVYVNLLPSENPQELRGRTPGEIAPAARISIRPGRPRSGMPSSTSPRPGFPTTTTSEP